MSWQHASGPVYEGACVYAIMHAMLFTFYQELTVIKRVPCWCNLQIFAVGMLSFSIVFEM